MKKNYVVWGCQSSDGYARGELIGRSQAVKFLWPRLFDNQGGRKRDSNNLNNFVAGRVVAEHVHMDEEKAKKLGFKEVEQVLKDPKDPKSELVYPKPPSPEVFDAPNLDANKPGILPEQESGEALTGLFAKPKVKDSGELKKAKKAVEKLTAERDDYWRQRDEADEARQAATAEAKSANAKVAEQEAEIAKLKAQLEKKK